MDITSILKFITTNWHILDKQQLLTVGVTLYIAYKIDKRFVNIDNHLGKIHNILFGHDINDVISDIEKDKKRGFIQLVKDNHVNLIGKLENLTEIINSMIESIGELEETVTIMDYLNSIKDEVTSLNNYFNKDIVISVKNEKKMSLKTILVNIFTDVDNVTAILEKHITDENQNKNSIKVSMNEFLEELKDILENLNSKFNSAMVGGLDSDISEIISNIKKIQKENRRN